MTVKLPGDDIDFEVQHHNFGWVEIVIPAEGDIKSSYLYAAPEVFKHAHQWNIITDTTLMDISATPCVTLNQLSSGGDDLMARNICVRGFLPKDDPAYGVSAAKSLAKYLAVTLNILPKKFTVMVINGR